MIALVSMDGPRKKGPYRAVPEWWKQAVRDELDRRGRGSRSRLAEFVPCATSAIAQLLAKSKPGKPPPPGTSRIAARVAEWTGVPLGDEEAFGELGEFLSELVRLKKESPESLPHALEIVRSIRAASEKAKSKG